MPIYEYTCHGCGKEVEVWQKISEKPKRVCPECGAHKLERLISTTSFHLKGSGWYVTDYAKGSSSGGASSGGASKSPAKKAAAKASASDD